MNQNPEYVSCPHERNIEDIYLDPCHRDPCKAERKHENLLGRKLNVWSHYGNGCYCCGENQVGFLVIEPMEAKSQGKQVKYLWLFRNGFPPGFRNACWNCNLGAARNQGVCPHTEERGSSNGNQ